MNNPTQLVTVSQAPPYSVEAEEAVIGSILIDPEAISRVEFLVPEDFYILRNRWVFIAVTELRRAGLDIDYLTVKEALEKRGQLQEAGGPARLTTLIGGTPTSMHVESYGRMVQEKARRRRLIEIASDLAEAAYNDEVDVSPAVSASIDRLSRSVTSNKGAVHWSHFLGAVYDEIKDALANPRELLGITTGFTEWNNISGGLMPGTTTRLVGDPGVGKSVLMMQVLINAASAGHPCALYELEMKGTQPARRAVSWKAHVMTTLLRTGKVSQEQLDAAVEALEELGSIPLFMSDDSHWTPAELRADLTRLREHRGIEVVAIDYEALLDGPGATENERRSRTSDEVHAIAKDLNLAILSVGDMTKEGIKGQATGQGAAAGTAHELHNADELIRIKQGKDENTIILTWEKLREPSGFGNFMTLEKVHGYPAFKEKRRL